MGGVLIRTQKGYINNECWQFKASYLSSSGEFAPFWIVELVWEIIAETLVDSWSWYILHAILIWLVLQMKLQGKADNQEHFQVGI